MDCIPSQRRPRSTPAHSWALALSLGFLAIVVACKPERKATTHAIIPPVEATQARTGSLPLVERLSGTVWADNQVALYPEIAGRIEAVLVENGQDVEAGQALVRLIDDTASERVSQAQAGLRIQEARLRQANAALNEITAQFNRIQALNNKALVSDVEFETLKARRESARADVELAKAQVEQAASNLAESQDALSKTVIRAPVTGVVGARDAEIGMRVTSNSRLFTIGNLDRVTVRVNLTDTMLRHIKVGQQVRIYKSDQTPGGPHLDSTLTRISPFLNQTTHSTVADIDLLNTHRLLRPGMFVPVDIFYGQSRQATLVPTSALYVDTNTGREGIYLVTQAPVLPPGQDLSAPVDVVFKPITPIARGASEVALDSAAAGDWVVTLGQNLLAAGHSQARIRPVSWEHVMELQSLRREDLLAEVLPVSEHPSAEPK